MAAYQNKMMNKPNTGMVDQPTTMPVQPTGGTTWNPTRNPGYGSGEGDRERYLRTLQDVPDPGAGPPVSMNATGNPTWGGPGQAPQPTNMPAVNMPAKDNPTLGGPGTAPQPVNMPTVQPAPQPNYSGRGRGGYNGQSSIGGVSAVNPQASQMDYDSLSPFIDSAYNQAMTRLNPQLEQQSNAFDQSMINRGMGVGSEAYNNAKQQMDFNQNDARQAAAFGAMGFGTNIQNQMFGQDNARSQLSNALLRSRWGLDEQGRQFDAGLGEQGRQFDANQGYLWDRADMNDLSWLDNVNFRDRGYNDQQDWNYFNARQGLLGAIPGWNPAMIDVAGNANAASNSQWNNYSAQNQQNQNAWGQITDILGMGGAFL